MKKLTNTLLAVFFTTLVLAQPNQSKIDSLTNLIGNQSGQERIETLIHLSEAYQKISSLEKSKEAEINAKVYAEQEGLDNMKGIIMLSMGKTAYYSNDNDLALEYIDKAIKLLEESKNYDRMSNAINFKGLVYRNMSQADKALEQFKLAIDISKKYNFPKQEASSVSSAASTYFSIGDYKNALTYFQQASGMFKELQDSLSAAKMMMNIGLIYWQWNQNELALKMSLEAKDLFEAKKDYIELGKIYNNIGRIYVQDIKDTVAALDYFERSLEMRQKTGNQLGMALVLANMGNIYSGKKLEEKAFVYYNRSLSISKSIGYNEGIALVYYYMGVALRNTGELKQSNRYLDSCDVVARKYGIASYYGVVNETKMSNYVELKDYTGFNREFRTFLSRVDSVKKELDKLKYQELDARNTIDSLAPALDQAHETIKEKNKMLTIYQWTTGIALVLLVFIVILFSLRSKNKRSSL